ncbi:hypothetical protein Tco_0540566 [Tanacetum coccineum]
MAVLNELITPIIQNAEYYQQYLQMAARKRKTSTAEEGVKKKAPPAAKPKKTAPVKNPTPAKNKSTKLIPSTKVRTDESLKRSLQLIDEEEEEPLVDEAKKETQTAPEPQPAPELKVDEDELNLQRVSIREPSSCITRTLPIVEGKGKGIATDEDDTSSHGDTEILRVKDEQGDELASHTMDLDEGQAGSDLGITLES